MGRRRASGMGDKLWTRRELVCLGLDTHKAKIAVRRVI